MSELIYREDVHTYTHNNIRIPGISELLKYWGYIDDTFYTSEEPRDIGTAVHAGTSAFDKGEDSYQLFEDPRILKRIEAYMLFKTDKKFMPTIIELPQHSDALALACRPDRVGYFAESSVPCIIDIKCGGEAKWHPLQTAGQQICIGDCRYYRRFGLYLRMDGTYKLKEHTDPTELALVQSLVALYWYNKNKGIKLKGETK